MTKETTLVLMLCLTLSGAYSYAHGVARIENLKGRDGTPIDVIEMASHTGFDKSNAIVPTINGHELSVLFTENIGQVAIEVFKETGGAVETFWIQTPDGLQTYIPLAGDYIITFTLSNGDEYYGEFTVTD